MVTKKQDLFIFGIIKGMTQREAYKNAYNTRNMKDSTIDARASELFNRPEIQARYLELKSEVTVRQIYDAVTVRNKIIETEMAILNTHFGQLLELGTDAKGKKLITIPLKDIKSFDLRAVQEIKYDKNGNLILKLYDKQSAINTLRELFGIVAVEKEEEMNFILQKAEEYIS